MIPLLMRLPWTVPLLLGSLLLAPAALAFDDGPEEGDEEDERSDDGGKDDEKEGDSEGEWEDEERDVDIDLDDESFRVESRRDSPRGRDTLRAGFQLDEARLDFRFEARDGETKLRLDEWVLLEFRDENGDGSFQAGEPVLQRFRTEEVSTRELRQTDLGTFRRINATYGVGGSGTWTLSFLVPSRAIDADGVRIASTEIKFDVVIEGFPYRESGSTVAVQFRFEAESEFEEGEKGGIPGLFAPGAGVRGFLRWVNHSVVDGTVRSVGVQAVEAKFDSSVDEFEGEATITFSYARGARIVHDPSVGVTLSGLAEAIAGPMGRWVLVGAGVAVAAILVAVTLGPSLRFRFR